MPIKSKFWEILQKEIAARHPAKELTDDEIKSVWKKMVCSVHMTKAELDFSRAILDKAAKK